MNSKVSLTFRAFSGVCKWLIWQTQAFLKAATGTERGVFRHLIDTIVEVDDCFLVLHLPKYGIGFELVGELLISGVQKLHFLGHQIDFLLRKFV